MISSLKLRFGPAPGEPPLEFAPGAMTVFVGPNNSGKSLALQELEGRQSESLIMDGAPVVHSSVCTRLDGLNRLTLLSRQTSESLHSPTAMLTRLLVNDVNRQRVRDTLRDAFGLHFVIDPTSMQWFEPRLSNVAPPAGIENSLDVAAREFFLAAKPIHEFSDGVRAFAGIVTALLATNYFLILIDEPEAFLHPPLSRKLGRFVAELAREREINVFAATHSADFLFGAVTSGVPVNIVRLTWDGEVATARLMPASEIATITRDPFMRTAGVLDAVFHRGAVVCEADADRAFYDEINARAQGAQDVLFLNANGKDSLARIVGPLRRFGIPAAAVADLDLIEQGAFAELLDACAVPAATANGLTALRGQVKQRYTGLMLRAKSAGIEGLTRSAQAEARDLLDQLALYGIFLVPVGELERWLPRVAGKSAWLQRAFETLHESDTSAVEEFMRRVAAWIHDPNRRGMPLTEPARV
ncbi:MAG TPA: AAA family ATPase [Thermoanaerobaculia bacterium]|nr:AAA family ATPase [Thermoanaerobaculia bacterium]